MTNIGLVGPGAFLLAFCAVDNLLAAVMLVFKFSPHMVTNYFYINVTMHFTM